MLACVDGDTSNYSAVALYTDDSGVTIDSRLITPAIDLTTYTTGTLEYTEGYTWSIDANDSNMVEISTDSGATWTQIAVSRPGDLYTETGALSELIRGKLMNHIEYKFLENNSYAGILRWRDEIEARWWFILDKKGKEKVNESIKKNQQA